MAFNAGYSAQFIGEVTLDPSNIPSLNFSVETFTPTALATLLPEQRVRVEGDSLEAGILITGSRCKTAGVLEITFFNATNAAVNPASQSFQVLAF